MLPVKKRRDAVDVLDWAMAPYFGLDPWMDPFWIWLRPAGVYGAYEVDIWDDAEHVYIEAELPGISKDDIQIIVERNTLSIQGQKKTEELRKDTGVHLRERYYGPFGRRFVLPSAVNTEEIDAVLKDGVLRITLDKIQKLEPKQVEVKAG